MPTFSLSIYLISRVILTLTAMIVVVLANDLTIDDPLKHHNLTVTNSDNTTEEDRIGTIIEDKGFKCEDDNDCFRPTTGFTCQERLCRCPDTMKKYSKVCKPETYCRKDSDCSHAWCDVANNKCHEVFTVRMIIVMMVSAVSLGVVFLLIFINRRVRHKKMLQESSSRTGLVPQTPVTPQCSFYYNGLPQSSPAITATVIPVRV